MEEVGNKAENFVDDDDDDDDGSRDQNVLDPPGRDALPPGFWDNIKLDLDEEEWEALQVSLTQPKPARKVPTKEDLQRSDELLKRKLEEREAQDKAELEEIGPDYLGYVAGKFRDDWNELWSSTCGSFEDTTMIPAMRYTHKPPPLFGGAAPRETLQVFSARITSISGGSQWPIDVFGFIAVRDLVDRNRNMIFKCTRESCQTLTEEDRNLVLAGPTRAVVLLKPHPVILEVDLKVKGTNESEDKHLSFLAEQLMFMSYSSSLRRSSYTSKLSTVEFTLGNLMSSVEATIFLRVVGGSWPDGFRCEFSASGSLDDYEHGGAGNGIDTEKIALLNCRADEVIVDGDGNIKLSRCVVSVQIRGELKVFAKAWKADKDSVEKEVIFKPSRAGLSYAEIDIGFCEIEVSVAWSVISDQTDADMWKS